MSPIEPRNKRGRMKFRMGANIGVKVRGGEKKIAGIALFFSISDIFSIFAAP